MGYIRTRRLVITSGHPLFHYAKTVTSLSNNLANAALFRERQVFTAVSKPESEWTDNEREVMEEIRSTLPLMKKKRHFPSAGKSVLGYGYLRELMQVSGNPDYFATGLPRQSAQHTLKLVSQSMWDFLASSREYRKHPGRFTGNPSIPGYKRKGGHTTAVITNQDCTIKTGTDGMWYAHLPLVKGTPVCIGEPFPDARLKEVTITPENGRFSFSFKFEVTADLPAVPEGSVRIASVDFGVENLMAVADNCGLPCLIYKGRAAKSVNQLYNKTIAAIVSRQTLETGKKFVPTPEYYAITNKRNDRIRDLFLKTAKHFVSWCVENRIDTVVLGVNTGWKQESGLGSRNNQQFVQIPHTILREVISYLCDWSGIRVVTREESYTSKASFLDGDAIPAFQEGNTQKYHFSGRRTSRGLYRAADGTVINADLNGAANILRKEFPEAFVAGQMPDFSCVTVIRHPDLENRDANYRKQTDSPHPVSHAKQKRLARKRLDPSAA